MDKRYQVIRQVRYTVRSTQQLYKSEVLRILHCKAYKIDILNAHLSALHYVNFAIVPLHA